MKFLVVLAVVLMVAQSVPIPRRNRNRIGKIVGGSDASPGQFPFQLSFQDTIYTPPFHFCGGSIIDVTTGLCAAHCVQGEVYDNPENLQIVAGELDMDVNEGTEQVSPVTKIVIHEGYDPYENDISILKFDALSLNSVVDIVTLPGSLDEPNGIFTVSGWGTTTDGSTPNKLQYVDVPYVTDEDCRTNYDPSDVTDSMICAGAEDIDSCQGDSGGPMIQAGTDIQVGIVSWGRGCGLAGFPGVYTQVSYFIDWIEANRVD